MTRLYRILAILLPFSLIVACDTLETDVTTLGPVPQADETIALDSDLGKPLLGVEAGLQLGKADSVNGYGGPRSSGMSSATRVWSVTRDWDDVEGEAGMAWPANSGLNWDEKYVAWVDSMVGTPSESWHTTFTLTTPWGKSLPAPTLECAEVAMFLRAAFASWYNLPFYLSAYSPTYSRLYFGHFGVVQVGGEPTPGYPSFNNAYADYTGTYASMSDADIIANWPSDSALRSRYLTTLKDDGNPFLGEDAYAGAYFDEVFLNKRVGHFMLRLLTNLGSMHLVDANRNTFNLAPEAIRAGDVLLQRWQALGIGHTVVVMRAEHLPGDTIEVETVFGSMPRIQPKWYGSSLSKPYFTSDLGGGVGSNSDGDTYVSLGGGLKRWRTAIYDGTRWRNVVPADYVDDWIDSTDHATLSTRPAHFETLLGRMTDEERRQLYLDQIDQARLNLELRPASCANRMRREEAFTNLYALNESVFGVSRQDTDGAHRTLADYVFAELVYDQSKTCCWNSSTDVMYAIVMDYNEKHVWDDATQTCNPPVVFKAVGGDYAVFEAHAATLGLSADWVAWSADESCPQSGTLNDVEAEHSWTPLCDIHEEVLGTDDGGTNTGGNNTGGTNTGGTNTGGNNTGGTNTGGGDSPGTEDPWVCGGGSATPPVAPLAALALLLGLRAMMRRRSA